MRLAVSNIAWPSGEDEAVARVLGEGGAEGVEVAPTKVWPRPLEASADDVRGYRDSWERRGFRVVALQALLFGRPELVLFEGESVRRRTVEYLTGMIDLAAALGAEAMVFGSPKNRLSAGKPREDVDAIAVASFRALGDHAARRGLAFCIEANPTAYGCDFVTTTAEAIDLVRRVGSEGFGLHVDSGGMALAGEDPAKVLSGQVVNWRHLHVSEPYLAPIGREGVDHRAFARAARQLGFDRWASIEMKETTDKGHWVDAIRESLDHARQFYVQTRDED
jgi:D-psicose/D-tagatose/L-ribulose 3-epimerase